MTDTKVPAAPAAKAPAAKAPAAKAPAAKTTKLAGKNAPKALKTFVYSAAKKDINVTFLAGEPVEGFPIELIEKYRKVGLIEPTKKEE